MKDFLVFRKFFFSVSQIVSEIQLAKCSNAIKNYTFI